jgi:4-amino-4-deoxy-L-arabinose transferase-like glycosyltransferase
LPGVGGPRVWPSPPLRWWCLVPYFLVHSSIGIYDPFVAAGSMLALLLQLELARRPRLDIALLLGVALGVTILAKPTGALALVLLPASLAVFDWRAADVRRRFVLWVALVGVALFVTACFWALTWMSPLTYAPHPVFHRTLGGFLRDPVGAVSELGPDVGRALWGYVTPPGILLALWGIVRVVVTRDRVGLVIALWAIGALAAWLCLSLWGFPRYGLQAVAPICVLVAIAGEDLWSRARRRFARPWVAVIAALVAAPFVLLDVRVLVSPGDAPYPGLDRSQYVTGAANRAPIRSAALAVLRQVPDTAPAQPSDPGRTVAELDVWPWATQLTLNGTHLTKTPRLPVRRRQLGPARGQ